MARFAKHKFPMKKRRAFEHIDGSEPMFEEMARKRKKRDDLSLLPDEDAEDIAVRFFAALDKRESAKVLGMTIDDVLWITPSQTLKGKAVVQKLLDKAPRPGFCQEMSKSVTLNNSKLASYRRAGSVTPRPGSDAFAVAQTVEILDGKVVKFEEERTSGF